MQAYLSPGSELAGYRIESFIGRGGMAVVYLAEHLRLGRKAALKLLAPELAHDEHFQQRFVRESRLAAAIDHPNIIPIYDAGEAEGLLYIAMRYVAGTDLRALLEQAGRLDPARTLAIVAQVAGALDAAHARGLVHRDVKPANILLGPGPGAGPDDPDHVYLSDFGLTKRSSSASGLTATGLFIGTLTYAAPEQIEGRPVDGRTDVYMLGCVLFECLAGAPPYRHDDDRALLWAHLVAKVPSVTAQRPELPAEVDQVVARAMAKLPEDRYPTCGALASDLRAALATGLRGAAVQPVAVPESASAPEPVPPRLALSTTVIDFGHLHLHGRSPERSVRLGNAGGGTLNPRVATAAGWLELRQAVDELVVRVDTATAGEHAGVVTIDSDGGSATIRVLARVDPEPLPATAARAAPAAPGAPEATAARHAETARDQARREAEGEAASGDPLAEPAASPAHDPPGTKPVGTRPYADQSEPPDRQRRRRSTRARILAGAGAGVGVVLVLLLIVAINANTGTTPGPTGVTTTSPSPGAVPTTSPPADKVILSDDFSSRASGWDNDGTKPVSGYTNGAYRISAPPSAAGAAGAVPMQASRVYPSAPPNLRIEVDGRRLPASDQSMGYGILCRIAGENAYVFTIADNYALIAKFGATYKELKEAGPQVDPNSTNHLQAVCTSVEGEQAVHLELWVNGQKAVETIDRDGPLPTGTVGLVVGTENTKRASVAEFDNFAVTEL